MKVKEKKESTYNKVQCYKGKSYGHKMHMCPSKGKDLDSKGNKVLQLTIEDNEDSLGKFCFMTIEEERVEHFERTIEGVYTKTICMAKKNNELIEKMEALIRENDDLNEKSRYMERSLHKQRKNVKSFNFLKKKSYVGESYLTKQIIFLDPYKRRPL